MTFKLPRYTFLAGLLCLVMTGPIAAQEPKLTATLDRAQISIGDSAQLFLKFEGGENIRPPNIAMPKGLSARHIGQAAQVSITNGRSTSSISHRYLIIPQQAGSFRIGPFRFTIHGKAYTAPAVTIEVFGTGRPISTEPRAKGAPGAAQMQDKIFVTLETPKKSLYLNEKTSLTVKLHVSELVIRDANFPVFDSSGFTMERVGQPKQYQRNLKGTRYNILEFNLTMFPTRTGELTLGPARVECTQLVSRTARNTLSDQFFANLLGSFATHKLVLNSDAVAFNVLPFPQEGRPADFQGAVGNFSMNASIAPNKVALGEPVTLTTQVRGDGNIKTITTPILIDQAGFKTYDPQRRVARNEIITEQVIVPKDTTLSAIPAVRFVFFDPKVRAYQTAQAGPFPLVVQPRESGDATKVVASKEAASQPPAPEELGSDILYIREVPGAWKKAGTQLYRHPAAIILFLVPLFLLTALVQWSGHLQRLHTDAAYARRLRAHPKAEKGYKDAAADLAAEKHQEFYACVSRTLREFLADTYHTSAQMIGIDMLASLSIREQLGGEGAEEIAALLTKCDNIRYASLSATQEEMKDDLAALRTALDRIAKIHPVPLTAAKNEGLRS